MSFFTICDYFLYDLKLKPIKKSRQGMSVIGIDIGGTCAKLAYQSTDGDYDIKLRDRGGIKFKVFRSDQLENLVEFLKEKGLAYGLEKVYATGGGSVKYRDYLEVSCYVIHFSSYLETTPDITPPHGRNQKYKQSDKLSKNNIKSILLLS